VVGRAEIAEHVWDESFDPFSNLIEVYVNRVRRKIDVHGAKPCCTPGGARDISLAWRPKAQRRAARRTPRRRAGQRKHAGQEEPLLDSVRVRLTFWYAGVLALFLVVLSLITYFIFWRSTLQRTDSNLAELSEAFLTTVQAEMLDNHGPDVAKLATQEAIVEHRFRDHVFAVFDPKEIC